MYEIVRPAHPVIVLSIMQQIPNLNINDLHKLDEKILSTGPLANATNQGSGGTGAKSNKIDKTKKDLFKKITSHLIGRNVSQLFRNPAIITDLRPLNNNIKSISKNVNILDNATDTGFQMQQMFRDATR